MTDRDNVEPGQARERGVQEGRDKSIAKQEGLKKLIKQHPIRDRPKVDSLEEPIKPEEARQRVKR